MKRAAFIILLLLALCAPARATELSDALDLDALEKAAPPETSEALGDEKPEDAQLDRGLERLWARLQALLPETLREVLAPLAAVVAVTLLCAMAEAFAGAGGRDASETVQFGGCLAIAVIGAQDLRSVLTLGGETLARLKEFSDVLLPTLTTAAAVAGAPGAAGAVWAASALFSDLLLRASDGLVLPLIYGFTAAACAASILGDQRLDGAVQLLDWAARTLLKALTLSFTAYLGVTRVLGASSDAATVKTAKTLLSLSLPVVGKLLSDASDALVAGAGLLRGAVGVWGMLSVLAMLLLPLLRLALRCLLFRAAAAVCSGIAGERVGRLIARLSRAYALLLGLVGVSAAVTLLAVISLIRTVTP